MNPSDTTLQIKSIKATRLFGIYDHLVELKQDRVTVIHGPNGVGKTALLRLTNAFLLGRYHEILSVPFEAFEIRFADESLASVELERKEGRARKMLLCFTSVDGIEDKVILDGKTLDTQHFAEMVASNVPFFSRIGPDEWIDRRTDEVIGSADMIAKASEYAPGLSKKMSVREPKGLRELRGRINVHFIEAQRLIRLSNFSEERRYRPGSESQARNTVHEYSRDLQRRLESALANYAKQSQKLDQTFPQRLLQGAMAPVTIDQLKSKMQKVEETRSRLKKIGILDTGDSVQEVYPLKISQLNDLKPEQVSVMSVYASDTEAKLAVLDELSGRIEILLGVLNRKFINKRVSISRESGLAIFGRDEQQIPVTALSSGEQHELVLLYDLLFKVKPNTLVLIDEPELSLHISWQKSFMDDLLDIIRLAQFDVLMATHSPYIVGEHTDLLVMLSSDPVK